MIKTRITDAYGLRYPFVSAGMAFIATAPLARAVAFAGGLGMIGATGMPVELLRTAINTVRAGGGKFGVNIIPRFNNLEHIALCVAEKVPVVVFFWDDVPSLWIVRLHAGGSKVWIQVGSVEEALAAKEAGADALVVQGSEAGGHNRAVAATLSLLPAVIDAVGDLPVIAAGGIADGRAVAAVLALGADAVWVGTRLLASEEAFAHEQYKRRVVAAKVGDTARHFIFGPDFPDASVRGIRNRIVREWEKRDDPPPYKTEPQGGHPVIGQASVFGQVMPMPRFTGLPPTPEFSGDFEEMSLLAGESVGQTKSLKPAGDIVRQMMQEAEQIIAARLASMIVPDSR